MTEPIVITGAGIVCSIGLNKEDVRASLLARQSGVGHIKYLNTTHKSFPVGEVKLSNEQMCGILGIPTDIPTTRTSLMGMMALKEAVEQAQLSGDDIRNSGFISGTTVGGMDKSEQYYLDFLSNDTKNEYIATHDCGACSEMIADYCGSFKFITTPSTACSSAANSVILGANIIRNGLADIVVAGGSECITKFHLNGFNSLLILDQEHCRPFDQSRAGLNLGEGAAYVVMERASSAKKRGAAILAELSGYGNACDAFHQTASSPDGEGAYRAMKQAIESAGMTPDDIHYINAHGTGTVNNDLSESQAMIRLFGEQLPPVSSTKAFTGHTTSAAGAIELVICLIALKHNFIPINLNWTGKDSDELVTPVLDDTCADELNNILCNSFGFGGNDSSLLISKWLGENEQ